MPGLPGRGKGSSRPLTRDIMLTDADLGNPQVVRAHYMRWLTGRPQGKAELMRFLRQIASGPLGPLTFFPDLHAWATLEFSFHGSPDSDWSPIDAYIQFLGDRLSPAGRAQFARWKEARIALYEVVAQEDGVLILREWDPQAMSPIAEPIRVAPTGVGKPLSDKEREEQVLLTYVAPWDPAAGLHVMADVARGLPKGGHSPYELLLSFRRPAVLVRPLPWLAGRHERQRLVEEWKRRDWPAWFTETLRFPFEALVMQSGRVLRAGIVRVLKTDAEAARLFGVYLETDAMGGAEVLAAGASAVLPIDVGSSNWAALQQYWEYRAITGVPAGIPPGEAGRVVEFRTR